MAPRTLLSLFAAAALLSAPMRVQLALRPGVVAAWRAGATAGGLVLLDGADGRTVAAERGRSACITNRPDAQPASLYLYFALSKPARTQVPSDRPLYVVVSYYDDAPGAAITLQYDAAPSEAQERLEDHYRPADDSAGGWRYGTHRWRRAAFVLRRPRLPRLAGTRGGQNLGADFRLCGAALFVRSVEVTAERPADWDATDRVDATDVRPLVHIGPGEQLIVGGFDPARAEDARPQAHALEAAVPALQSLGVTSHEGYVRWNLCEPKEGQFDWSVYDRFVDVYRRHHLKWVPFLICGSAYSLPDWYYRRPGSQGYVCLEHHQDSDVQSLWNPTLRDHVARFIQAFCAHYGPTGVIESILLGVTGNYGEAIYPASGNDWTADIHGKYHTHAGYWAGDPYAARDFNRWVLRRYGSMDHFRDAWGSGAVLPKRAEVRPFLRADAPNERAWLDMCEWYIGSMTDYAAFWLRTTRRYFPKGDIYLCTGGDAVPEHGSDFGDQCKAAAEVGAGVRITNEGSDYHTNFTLTRWVASAARQYGCYFSFEPASGVSTSGVVARVYNATASGARGLHYYYNNLFDSQDSRDAFVRTGGWLQARRPVVEIAVYYPETQVRLTGRRILDRLRPLRDRFDYDFLSDGMIADGGLARVKALVLVEGAVAEARTWRAIEAWVRRGGLLLSWRGLGEPAAVPGETGWSAEAVFGPHPDHGRGRLLEYGGVDAAGYGAFLSDRLAAAPELSPLTRAMVRESVPGGGLFATACAPDQLLWLNTTEAPAVRGGVTIPANGIAEQRVR